VIKQILQCWEGRLGTFPNDYICYDLETTGLNPQDDLIWQIGHCQVIGGLPSRGYATRLNWFLHEETPQDWLVQKIAKHQAEMRAADRHTGCSVHAVKQGEHPTEVLRRYTQLFAAAQMSNVIVGHNIIRFDNNMFLCNIDRCFHATFDFDPWRVIDTAALVKAMQLGVLPFKGEPPGDFCWRILKHHKAKGVFFSLDKYCVPTFKLASRYNLNSARMHTAGYDAMITHLLLYELLNGDY